MGLKEGIEVLGKEAKDLWLKAEEFQSGMY